MLFLLFFDSGNLASSLCDGADGGRDSGYFAVADGLAGCFDRRFFGGWFGKTAVDDPDQGFAEIDHDQQHAEYGGHADGHQEKGCVDIFHLPKFKMTFLSGVCGLLLAGAAG